ncbi:hypothetical protein H9X85_08810 [Anaerotignum lactatifermentans]|uniref:DUF1292 domain-containing protein n=1 Tax=Anaerotignum lactatifermentans TaxID=160404 RepID=A0ABS2GCN0_9FIRM|nr:DUF6762 family protein [Anaerotignum lactatifermentans]MBM6829836.1 hypothetical protein [Anaerotignum lactatifermentans]MBM6878224.1 hypothetical protein [Anaerotignum lactatifermentans]MBM6951304.1 hypothetical protein [Anaerotignum lactatifermentans]
MEEAAIVVMLKDQTTGFLDKELGCYTVAEGAENVFQVYAAEKENEIRVVLKLTCEKELSDWEYDAVFDYYDMETLAALVDSIEEEEGHFNPVWKTEFSFSQEADQMEEKLSAILEAHKRELDSVYEVIADKRDDYCEE